MQNELLIAILAGLGGMLGWGFADFFVKKTVDKIGAVSSLVWAHLFGTVVLVFFAIFQFLIFGSFIAIPNTLSAWAGLILFGILQMIVYWLVYEGFGKGQVSVLSPVFASFAGLVALISIAFLGERAGDLRILSLFIIFAGIVLISTDFKGWNIKSIKLVNVPGFKEVAIATLLAALWTLGWGKFVGGEDWLSYALFMYLFMTVAAFFLSRFMKVKLSGVSTNLWKFLFIIGLGEAIAYTAISLGYSLTSTVSVVALLSGAFSLPVIILARIFLKEKINHIQTIGSIVIFTGIMALSLL